MHDCQTSTGTHQIQCKYCLQYFFLSRDRKLIPKDCSVEDIDNRLKSVPEQLVVLVGEDKRGRLSQRDVIAYLAVNDTRPSWL